MGSVDYRWDGDDAHKEKDGKTIPESDPDPRRRFTRPMFLLALASVVVSVIAWLAEWNGARLVWFITPAALAFPALWIWAVAGFDWNREDEDPEDEPAVSTERRKPQKIGGGITGLTDLPVAKTVMGDQWWLSFWVPREGARSYLIVGVMGSGKGSALWAPITAMRPALERGLVCLIGIDPKRMEFGMAPGIFAELVKGYGTDEIVRIVEILDDEVRQMTERQDWLTAAGKRLHVPTPQHPLHVIAIDELMAVTYFIRRADPVSYNRIMTNLNLIGTQGRACGWLLIAATQNPKAEVMDMLREAFATRVCLRPSSATHVDMALGWGARSAGALADKIPKDGAQGTGYVLEDGEPVKIRFRWVDDEEVTEYGAGFVNGARRDTSAAPTSVSPVVGDLPDYGPAIEVEEPGATPEASVPELLLATWPSYRGEPNRFDHLDNLASRLGITAETLTEYLDEAGITPTRGSARPLSGGAATTKDGLTRGVVEAWHRSGRALHAALHAREGVDLRR